MIQFSYMWIKNFGWENTILCEEDFKEVEKLGDNDIDGTIYIATNLKGKRYLLSSKNIQH